MKRRILVVDDESIVAQDITECLHHMGCEVIGHALSGPDAIAKAGRLRPDLIMMDIVLQGPMDGVEAATTIRREFDIPCVFLTAYSDGAVLSRAKTAAPAGYMVKPFEEAGLRSTVEIALYKVDLERALRESREWLLTTLMSIADGVIATDHDGNIKFLNPPAERITGWRGQEAAGRKIEEVLRIEDDRTGEKASPLLHRALEQGQIQSREKGVALTRRDGTVIPIADSAAPIRNREGHVVGAVSIFRDITERRRGERSLEEDHDRLEILVCERTAALRAEVEERRRAERDLAVRVAVEAMLASLSSLFLALKPEGREQGIIRALEAIGGFMKTDRCYLMQFRAGGQVLECTAEWCAAEVAPLCAAARCARGDSLPQNFEDITNHSTGLVSFIAGTEGGALNEQLAASHGAGSLLWIKLGAIEDSTGFLCVDSIARRDWNADELRTLALAGGVVTTALHRLKAESDRERLQAQLQQSLKMEAVGKLSGGIAHDFNNMLLPIIGYADMVAMRLPECDPSHAEMREIKRAAERATALTRQLLAFSRKQVSRKTVFDLNENLGQMSRMLSRIIGEDIHLLMALSPGIVPLRADQGQIEQIIMNLVINARDAMPHGGSISVRTMLVDSERFPIPIIGGVATSGKFGVLTVSDTGCGMSPEVQEHIFEPFFTTKGLDGTGLGLSVIYGIVHDHLGGIEVQSQPGRGTTFHIFLPAADPSLVQPPAADHTAGHKIAAAFRGKGERVLLIEDEEAVNHLVRTALTQHGYSVTAAATAKEARARFDESKGAFDMVLSDAVLPDGNGLQLVDAFLRVNPAIRALVSSGYTDKNSLMEMAKTRRVSFLPKPYSLPELFKTVAEVMKDPGAHLLE
jgi:two-component system cell cycle sensor histidine kinase/response regulator CckA